MIPAKTKSNKIKGLLNQRRQDQEIIQSVKARSKDDSAN